MSCTLITQKLLINFPIDLHLQKLEYIGVHEDLLRWLESKGILFYTYTYNIGRTTVLAPWAPLI